MDIMMTMSDSNNLHKKDDQLQDYDQYDHHSSNQHKIRQKHQQQQWRIQVMITILFALLTYLAMVSFHPTQLRRYLKGAGARRNNRSNNNVTPLPSSLMNIKNEQQQEIHPKIYHKKHEPIFHRGDNNQGNDKTKASKVVSTNKKNKRKKKKKIIDPLANEEDTIFRKNVLMDIMQESKKYKIVDPKKGTGGKL